MELNVNIVAWNYLVNGMLFNLIKNLYVPFGISFDPKRYYKDGDCTRISLRPRDPMMSLCYRLIAYSIARRSQAPKKVTMTDLFYLRGMGVGSINVPYLLAMYLRLFASRRKQGAMISGDMVVLVRLQICVELDDTWAWIPAGPARQEEEEVHGMCEDFHGQREGRCALHEITESPIEYQRRTRQRTDSASTSIAPQHPDP
nr:hypothetical protein [Tanacetum cinerariifolium]